MTWEFGVRELSLPRHYSVYEGNEISSGYQIGSITLKEEIVLHSSIASMSTRHYLWKGDFRSRDARYSSWEWFPPQETADDVLTALFVLLQERQASAGPFHAVRCSVGAPPEETR